MTEEEAEMAYITKRFKKIIKNMEVFKKKSINRQSDNEKCSMS